MLLTLSTHRAALPLDQAAVWVGPDDLVWAATPPAHKVGVQRQMTLRQAQSLCPGLQLYPVALPELQSAQDTLLQTLAAWDLPVEESGWGRAYLDLHTVAATRVQVQPLVVELGRQVRRTLGVDLQPCLGWDSGKFTARAAATTVTPGRARLVNKEEEARFLAPLPITLLPLPPDQQQRLAWLGITTLGQFARLPPAAVLQQFGNGGRMAQRWAQGHDPRPVHAQIRSAFCPLHADIDPPTGLLGPVLEVLLDLMRPELERLALELSGCRRLHLDLDFVEGSRRTLLIPFVAPVVRPQTLQATLSHHLQSLNWPSELARITLTGLETGELPAVQLSLFPEAVEEAPDPGGLARRLGSVYGPVFRRPQLADPTHPVAERRSTWLEPV